MKNEGSYKQLITTEGVVLEEVVALLNDSTEMQNEGSATNCCANCGIAAVDEIKLKLCPHCDLVHYCSEKCQRDHRDLHEAMCNQRAAEFHDDILFKQPESIHLGDCGAEIRDEILFKQPESNHLGDCPICFLPMPLGKDQKMFRNCCCTLLCSGCSLTSALCEKERGDDAKCPFCRKITSTTDEENTKRLSRRAEANDPIALTATGYKYYNEEDYESAFQYFTRASEVGSVHATFMLGSMYWEGKFVEKNEDECISFLKQAAIRGHVDARHALGIHEWDEKRFDRAVKHWIISASLGHNESIQELKSCYKEGHVSKDDFAKALRANQAAVDAMKSPQREAAAKSRKLEVVL